MMKLPDRAIEMTESDIHELLDAFYHARLVPLELAREIIRLYVVLSLVTLVLAIFNDSALWAAGPLTLVAIAGIHIWKQARLDSLKFVLSVESLIIAQHDNHGMKHTKACLRAINDVHDIVERMRLI